jgi:hypothetical protein
MPSRFSRWRSAYRVFSRGFFRLELLAGQPGDDSVPVVMCLWNRPERMDDILHELAAQESVGPVRLILWNNRRRDGARYRRVIRAGVEPGSRLSVEFFNSPVNMGGVARFFVAVKLRRGGYRGPFIMLDDDEVVPTDFVSRLLASWRPHVVAGFWSFRLAGAYWNREFISDGEPADYVGTGGSVCDIDIVEHRDFFSLLPTQYAFMEDQWMSYYAQSHGWDLKKVDVNIEFVMDETNQAHNLVYKKEEFYSYLHRNDTN